MAKLIYRGKKTKVLRNVIFYATKNVRRNEDFYETTTINELHTTRNR